MNTLWNTATKAFTLLRDSPLLYPYRTKSLAGLPTAIIITPEYSYCENDGNMYASKLLESQVLVLTKFSSTTILFTIPHS